MAPANVKNTKRAAATKKGGGGSKAQLVRDTVATLKATRPDCADGVPRKLVANFCGYKSHNDGAFKVLISGLVKHKGHMIYCGSDAVDLTEEGRQHATVTELKTGNDSQLEQAMSNVKGKARLIVEMLSDGKTLSRAHVAEKLGY